MANLFMLLVFAFFIVFSEAGGVSFYNAYIQSVENGKCVTIGEDKQNGLLAASDCMCNPLQMWKLEGEFVVNVLAKIAYMDQLYGSFKRSNGDEIGIHDKTSYARQKWSIRDEGDGSFTFAGQENKKCLHQLPGGKLVQWDCNGDQAQKWKIVDNPCPKLPKEPSRFQLQNPATGLCAGIMGDNPKLFAKIGTTRCSCENKFHYWKRKLAGFHLISDGSGLCMGNRETGGEVVTQSVCYDSQMYRFGFIPYEDGSFNIVSSLSGKCVHVFGRSENSQLLYTECDKDDQEQRWRIHDQCHPEPPPTPKPTQPPVTQPPVTLPPPTQAPPTLPPQPVNVIPQYLTYFFGNGQMNWLTPERYNLLYGGRWDPATATYHTVDGRQIKPNTPDWTKYFGDANPSFLNVLFQGKTFNETFGWMRPDFFDIWTSWKTIPTPAPTPAPQPPNVIPSYQVPYFNNGQMNWLNPMRYSQLLGGRWDPSTFTWYTADGKQIKPNTPEWTSYFGTLQPSDLNQIFPNGASFNQVFGWMTPTFFQQWTGWNQAQVNRIQIFIPGNIPVGTRQLFASGQVNWLTPERVNLLAGGQWTGYDYITRTQMRVTPGSPNWSTYFGPADLSLVNALLSGPAYWDQSLSWVTEAVKNVPKGQYTGSFEWNKVVH